MMRKSRTLLAVAVFVCVTGCGGGEQNAKFNAIQAAFDANPVIEFAPNGRVCGYFSKPDWEKVSIVHIKPAGIDEGGSMLKCFEYSWPASIKFISKKDYFGNTRSAVQTGRYIVDKVGEEQDDAQGVKSTPFKAHFEPSEVGAAMFTAKVVERPPDISNMLPMHKDADGKWVVR